MAITTPPVIDSFSGPAPNRTDPLTFSTRTDARLAEWQPNVDQNNALSAWTNDAATQTETNAQTAETSAAISASSANFKGLWDDLTGAANIPFSVSHNNDNWQLVSDLADITLSEPGITADWEKIPRAATLAELTSISLWF